MSVSSLPFIILIFSKLYRVRAQLQTAITFGDYEVIAKPGHLIARVMLSGDLSLDTTAGQLLVTSVQSVHVAPVGHQSEVLVPYYIYIYM